MECDWDSLHTVILGLDPYPGVIKHKSQFVADGLAFSSRHSDSCPKSLDLIFKAIETDLYDGLWLDVPVTNFDLTKWANQGILLLNSALTFPLGQKSGAHVELWKPFITYVLQEINARKDSVGVILMGKVAQSYRPLFTNSSFAVYQCNHPASAVYTGGKWNHDKCFLALDSFHKTINNIQIKF
jgi:uracil-DNA glycosylase